MPGSEANPDFVFVSSFLIYIEILSWIVVRTIVRLSTLKVAKVTAVSVITGTNVDEDIRRLMSDLLCSLVVL